MILHTVLAAVLLAGASPPASADEAFWSHFVRVTDSNIDELILMRLDANGDGRPEIFLAPKWTCGNGGCGWRVYSPTPDRHVFRYLGEAGFHIRGYRLSGRMLTHCWHMSAGDCQLGQYHFDGYLMRELEGRSCSGAGPDAGPCEKELAAIREWQHDKAPQPMWGTFSGDDRAVGALKWVYRNLVSVDEADVPQFDEVLVVDGAGK